MIKITKKTNVKRKVWVFHHYASPPTLNGFTRPYNFAINMNDSNYKTTIFSASYLHFADANLIEDKQTYIVEEHSEVPFIFVKTPSSAKNTKARVKNMLSFYMNLFKTVKKYSSQENRPDIIVASSPHPLTMLAGIQIAKKMNIPCICEIRDLWPEAIFAFGKTKEKSVLGKLLVAGEKWIYEKADALIFLKEGDTDYLKEKNWTLEQGGNIDLNKCHYINNGVNIESFYEQVNKSFIHDPDLESDKFNVIYTGAIRPVNNVGNILDAAKLLDNYKDIQFLIYGDGNQLSSLRKRVIDENISNVLLKGYIDKKNIPYILSRSSVNILNYSQEKYNWSRGNSSNKLFEYMASGKPIISTVKIGYSPIEKYGSGLSLDKDTSDELAKNILKVYHMPNEEYKQIGDNAKAGAKNYDYKLLTKKFINVMESLI